MAVYYIYSGAAGTGTGADWTNAFTTLTTAFSGKAAGDTFYVADDHAESTAGNITLSSPGTAASPCYVICVNRSGSVPPVSADLRTTATVSTSGTSNITFGLQTTYWYGITFSAGSAANIGLINVSNTSGTTQYFSSCGFTLNTTAATARFWLCSATGQNGIFLRFTDCTWTFGSNASQYINTNASAITVQIVGGSMVVGANVPSVVFNATPTALDLIGVDLSAFGSGKTIIAAIGTSGRVRIQNCRLGASVTVAGTPTTRNQEITVIRSDSTSANTRYEKRTTGGSETTETTIVRTGGASDGTTAQSRKIVTTANASWVAPFESDPLVIWNDTTGSSKTITVYGIWGGASVPNNDDIWLEVSSLSNSSYPLASLSNNTKADVLAANSALASDTSSWGGSTTPFKMTVSVTPQLKGPLMVYVKAAKASSTFYYDPLVTVS